MNAHRCPAGTTRERAFAPIAAPRSVAVRDDSRPLCPRRRVAIAAAALRDLRTAFAAARPLEGCGLLGGTVRRHEGDEVIEVIEVTRFLAVENAARSRDRFVIRPPDFAAALALVEHGGSRLVGYAHSHPDGTAAPSEQDRRELWPHQVHLIAAPHADGRCDVAAFWAASAEKPRAARNVAERRCRCPTCGPTRHPGPIAAPRGCVAVAAVPFAGLRWAAPAEDPRVPRCSSELRWAAGSSPRRDDRSQRFARFERLELAVGGGSLPDCRA